MADPSGEFMALMERVRGGSQDAARELFDRYGELVQRVVRRALHKRMRSQYDSVDFAQSVWASFFFVPVQRYTFETPEDLVKFLSRVAYHKVVEKARKRLNTQKRAGQVVSLDNHCGQKRPLGAGIVGLGPTPSQEAMATERWENMLEGQPPELRRALTLLRQGHSHAEVADALGIHPKLLQRVLQQLRKVSPP